jgi:hypothetical protein
VRGHAPIVAVLLAQEAKADESIPDPKGRESRTPTDFPLHNIRVLGAEGRGHHRLAGPLWQANARWVGEAHVPVVAVLVPAVKADWPASIRGSFASGPAGRTDGGLFSPDGIHATTIAYGLIAHEVIRVMNLAKVEFRAPTGDPKPRPGAVDFSRVLASDTLINRPPTSLSGNLATLGWLDDKLDWVQALF